MQIDHSTIPEGPAEALYGGYIPDRPKAPPPPPLPPRRERPHRRDAQPQAPTPHADVIEQLIRIKPWFIYLDMLVIGLTVTGGLSLLFNLPLTNIPYVFDLVPATGAMMTVVLATLIIASLSGKNNTQRNAALTIKDAGVKQTVLTQILNASKLITENLYWSISTMVVYFILISVSPHLADMLNASGNGKWLWLVKLSISIGETLIPVRNIMTLQIVDSILAEEDIVSDSMELAKSVIKTDLRAIRTKTADGEGLNNRDKRVILRSLDGDVRGGLKPERNLAPIVKDSRQRRTLKHYVLGLEDNDLLPTVGTPDRIRYDKALKISGRLRRDEDKMLALYGTPRTIARGPSGVEVTEETAGTIMNLLRMAEQKSRKRPKKPKLTLVKSAVETAAE